MQPCLPQGAIERDGFLGRDDGFFHVAQKTVSAGEVGMGIGEIGIDLQRAANQGQGFGGPFAILQHNPQKIEGLGIIGVGVEHRTVKTFRVVEIPCLVPGNRFFK